MIKIGLTGGIGSGKTTVSQIFASKGIPVFNSDLSAREAEKDPQIAEALKIIVGDDAYVNGEFDRAKVRSILFNDKEKLKQVTKVITPYIKASFERFCEKHKEGGIVMLESAILFENGHENGFEYIVTVTATENTRIKRVMQRDNLTAEEVVRKVDNQLPDIEKVDKSNFVIINENYDITDRIILLEKQVMTILKAISADVMVQGLEKIYEIAEIKK